MSGSQNDESSPSETLRVDADGCDVRATRQGNHNITPDAIEAGRLPNAALSDDSGAEVPKHLLWHSQGRGTHETEAYRRPERFQLGVPVRRGLLHGDEALVRGITENRDRPVSRGAGSDRCAGTTSDRRRTGKKEKNGPQPAVNACHAPTNDRLLMPEGRASALTTRRGTAP
jgi:hypothetical protein